MILQTALAVALLCAAGLLIHSLTRLMRVPAGFDPSHVMSAQFALDTKRYDNDATTIAFYRDLVEKLEAYPQVRRAGAVYGLPMSKQNASSDFTIVGDPQPDPANTPNTYFHGADIGYAGAMGIRVVRGRWFDRTDTELSEHTAVINETLAKQFFAGRDPIGHYIQPKWSLGDGDQKPLRIVGVIGDMKYKSLGDKPVPELFQPFTQFPMGGGYIVVRMEGDPQAAVPLIRQVVRELDPSVPLSKILPMTEVVSGSAADARFRTLLLMTFAGLALTIAVTGIYGVMAHTVAQRRREIGIRVALGAAARDIVKMVVSEGTVLIIVGTVFGVILALIGTRGMQSMLFNVGAADPVSLAGSALLLMITGLVAILIPARRALQIDPVEVLRYE